MYRVATLASAVVLSFSLAAPATAAVSAGARSRADLPDGSPDRAGARIGQNIAIPHERFSRVGRPAYADDHIVVKFAAATTSAARQNISLSLGGRQYRPARWGDFGRVTVAAGDDINALVKRFRNNPDVVYAERDPMAYAELDGVQAAAATNDPLYSLQWFLERIKFEDMQTINPGGGAGAVVAVIDTGVLYGNGVDCESGFPGGRGLDLGSANFVAGYDFVDDDNQPFDEGVGDTPTDPRFGHGTFVAGLIAATTNNTFGGTGIAPEVSIMPLRVLGLDGSGTFSAVAEAIDFAVAHGADVINMSLGGTSGSNALSSAVDAAHAAGVVMVAAAGNEGKSDAIDYPANYPAVIAVGATAYSDGRASYSNRGANLDLMAPAGANPFSVVGANDLRDAALSGSFLHDPTTGDTSCAFFWADGTSFAAPQVAAAAALLSSLGVDDPDLIRLLLNQGARDLGATGFDSDTGNGLLDLYKAHQGFGFSFN
jgi:subtilisin family serine protease